MRNGNVEVYKKNQRKIELVINSYVYEEGEKRQ